MRHELFSEVAALCSSEKTPIPCVMYVKYSDEETSRSFGYSKKEFSPPALVLLHHWFVEHGASAAQFEEHAHHYLRMLEVAQIKSPAGCFDYSEGGSLNEFEQQDRRASHYRRWVGARLKMAHVYENVQNIDYLVMICINPKTLREEIENNTASFQSATIYETWLNNVPPSLKNASALLKRRYEEHESDDDDDDGDEESSAAGAVVPTVGSEEELEEIPMERAQVLRQLLREPPSEEDAQPMEIEEEERNQEVSEEEQREEEEDNDNVVIIDDV